MRKHRSIWNKLSKKELVHVIEMGLVDDPLKIFKETRKEHLQMEAASPRTTACWECRFIARKLGIEE